MDKHRANKLVARIGMGNDRAFDILYTEMRPILYASLRPRIKNPAVIDDIIHNTFVVVLEQAKSLTVHENCFSWIYTICKYKAMNRTMKDDEILTDYSETPLSEGTEDFDETLLRADIRDAINTLPMEDREIVFQRIWNRLTFRELADMFHTSQSTMKRRVDDIFKRLGELLKEDVI